MAFARHSKITNAKGRIDYLTNPKRQEEIVMVVKSEKSFDDYIEFEKQQKNVKNQAREHIFTIPHEYYGDDEKIKDFVNEVVQKTLPAGTPHLVAVHWNKRRTNFHMHVLYFERQRNTKVEYQTYNRDYWIKENGALAIKKEDRYRIKHKKGDFKLDENGNKIAKTEPFTKKNPYFKSVEFLNNVQDTFRDIMKNRGFASYKNRFKQVHIGTFDNTNAEKLKAYNKKILDLNKKITDYELKFGTQKADELERKIKNIPNYTYKLDEISENLHNIDSYSNKLVNNKPNLAPEGVLGLEAIDNTTEFRNLAINLNVTQMNLVNLCMDYLEKIDRRILELDRNSRGRSR